MTTPSVPPDFLLHNIAKNRYTTYIGTIVHVRGYDKCRAALVTGVDDDKVFVTIFAPNLPMQNAVVYSWHTIEECYG